MLYIKGRGTSLQAGDRIVFVCAPGAGVYMRILRPSENAELLAADGGWPFVPGILSFDDWRDLASLLVDVCGGLTITGGELKEKGDLTSAEFEVCARE